MTRRLIITSLAAAALLAPTASAQNGVTFDPGSPTGKEYAIPLEQAREDASGTGGDGAPVTRGTRDAPLFGAGVGESDGAGQSPSSSSEDDDPGSTSNRRQKPSRKLPGSTGRSADDAIAGTQIVRATVPNGNSGDILTVGALALAVLLLGGVLGSIIRKRA